MQVQQPYGNYATVENLPSVNQQPIYQQRPRVNSGPSFPLIQHDHIGVQSNGDRHLTHNNRYKPYQNKTYAARGKHSSYKGRQGFPQYRQTKDKAAELDKASSVSGDASVKHNASMGSNRRHPANLDGTAGDSPIKANNPSLQTNILCHNDHNGSRLADDHPYVADPFDWQFQGEHMPYPTHEYNEQQSWPEYGVPAPVRQSFHPSMQFANQNKDVATVCPESRSFESLPLSAEMSLNSGDSSRGYLGYNIKTRTDHQEPKGFKELSSFKVYPPRVDASNGNYGDPVIYGHLLKPMLMERSASEIGHHAIRDQVPPGPNSVTDSDPQPMPTWGQQYLFGYPGIFKPSYPMNYTTHHMQPNPGFYVQDVHHATQDHSGTYEPYRVTNHFMVPPGYQIYPPMPAFSLPPATYPFDPAVTEQQFETSLRPFPYGNHFDPSSHLAPVLGDNAIAQIHVDQSRNSQPSTLMTHDNLLPQSTPTPSISKPSTIIPENDAQSSTAEMEPKALHSGENCSPKTSNHSIRHESPKNLNKVVPGDHTERTDIQSQLSNDGVLEHSGSRNISDMYDSKLILSVF
jgi:hypothetical protein